MSSIPRNVGGRPAVGEPINVRLGDELLARVDEAAAAANVSRAEHLRTVVAAGLTRMYLDGDTGRSDADLARLALEHYEDATEELHRRRPFLAGLWEAINTLTEAPRIAWCEAHPDEEIPADLQTMPGVRVLTGEYAQHLRAIAGGE